MDELDPTTALSTAQKLPMNCTVSPIRTSDFQRWSSLFTAYCVANGCSKDHHKIVTAWNWLIDETHPLQGLIAYGTSGEAVGFAHFHSMPDSLEGREAGHLADIYTKGNNLKFVEAALHQTFIDHCHHKGWS